MHLITPLEFEGTDTVVIVARGWVYSPDASTVDLARWREPDSVSMRGYLLPLLDSGPPAPTERSAPLRSLNRAALESAIQRPVAPVLLVMTSDSAARADSVPRRLEPRYSTTARIARTRSSGSPSPSSPSLAASCCSGAVPLCGRAPTGSYRYAAGSPATRHCWTHNPGGGPRGRPIPRPRLRAGGP